MRSRNTLIYLSALATARLTLTVLASRMRPLFQQLKGSEPHERTQFGIRAD